MQHSGVSVEGDVAEVCVLTTHICCTSGVRRNRIRYQLLNDPTTDIRKPNIKAAESF